VTDDAAALDAGDLLWIDFGQPVGHEQGGRRPAVVLTSRAYNIRSSVLVVCPITRRRRDWPFEVGLPLDSPIEGFVLVDQIKVIDPATRLYRRAGRLPGEVLGEVRAKLAALLGIPVPT
jgi:mRNA interferase MazF